jgi:acetylglutamate kinase
MRVIKIGGRAQGDLSLYTAIATEWSIREGSLCVVHGGGDEVSALQKLMGGEPVFVGGRRVTGERDIDALRMALSGSANKRVVAALQNAGAPAVGLSGEDAALIGAERTADARLGMVGEPVEINTHLLNALLEAGFLPVISPLGRALRDGAPLNINGDDAAAAIAAALRASELLFVADVPGVLRHGSVVQSLFAADVGALMRDGSVTGGMIAKLEAALRALDRGVASVRIGGREMISDSTTGTTISPTPSLV